MYKLKQDIFVYQIPTGNQVCLLMGMELEVHLLGAGCILTDKSNKYYVSNSQVYQMLSIEQVFNKEQILKDKSDIVQRLKLIYDPEIPVDIYNLGLIYNIEHINSSITVTMTLTSPTCGMSIPILQEVENALDFKNISNKDVQITFSPIWNKEMMSEQAKAILGLI